MHDTNPLAEDLNHVLAHTDGLWDELRNQRIFITGGTGFWGCWLLESFLWANRELGLNAAAVVLTRNPRAFQHKAPHLATDPSIRLHPGDVRSFAFPPGAFSHIVHAAAETTPSVNAENPLLMFDTIVYGTRRVLDFATTCGARKLLLASSGAVYGHQPEDLLAIPETYRGAPDPTDPATAYPQGKRAAEHLCILYAAKHAVEIKITRGFAFVGPYLPLDRHFAIGNFIACGLQGQPIQVLSDGASRRSYLYVADLAIWLWTILLRGQKHSSYNVGSEFPLVIRDVATAVASLFQTPTTFAVRHALSAHSSLAGPSYIPSTAKARTQLGLRQTISFSDSLRRTIAWCQKR